jgi:hypothetical protein
VTDFFFLWLLLLDLRLLSLDLRTVWSDVTNDAAMMVGRDNPLRGLSLMWRDIFWLGKLFNIFFPS